MKTLNLMMTWTLILNLTATSALAGASPDPSDDEAPRTFRINNSATGESIVSKCVEEVETDGKKECVRVRFFYLGSGSGEEQPLSRELAREDVAQLAAAAQAELAALPDRPQVPASELAHPDWLQVTRQYCRGVPDGSGEIDLVCYTLGTVIFGTVWVVTAVDFVFAPFKLGHKLIKNRGAKRRHGAAHRAQKEKAERLEAQASKFARSGAVLVDSQVFAWFYRNIERL